MGLTALGTGALVLALASACATAAACVSGRPDWGRRGLGATFALVTVALVALAWAFVGQDYSLVYVADHASRETSWPYRLAGVWGGMAGSLLLWTWMLAAWALVAASAVRRQLTVLGRYGCGNRTHSYREQEPAAPDLAGRSQAVLALVAAVFLGLLVFVSRPFATLAVPAIDGGGLTPILRHPAMLYHPPLLYAGYVGLAVPFALAVAGGREWLAVARRFMIASLVLLAVGMTAGAHWAYVELGWGGYWAWDPVENGALLPWLAGVGFVHSAVAGRGAHGWAFLAFGLSLLGAFLTRSGVTDSVHAFAEARTVGRVLLAALVFTAVALVVLVVRRRAPPGKPGAPSPVLRVNNALLLAVIVVVGFGLLFPVVSGDGVIVTGRYFAIVTAPLALGVLAAIGVGPRLGWRPRPWAEVRPRLRPAGWGIVALAAAAVLLDDPRPVPLAMIGLAGSAAALTIAEWRERRPRRAGLIAHLGVAVLLAGVAGTATGTHRTASLVPGQSVTVRDYTLRLAGVVPVPAPDGGRAAQATFTVERDGRRLATLRPVALVARSGDRVSEAALRSTPAADLQVALRTVSSGGGAVVVEIFVVPLAQWVWWGALLMAAGIAASAAGSRQTAPGSPQELASTSSSRS